MHLNYICIYIFFTLTVTLILYITLIGICLFQIHNKISVNRTRIVNGNHVIRSTNEILKISGLIVTQGNENDILIY